MSFRRFLATILAMVASVCSCLAEADGPYVLYHEDGTARVVTVGVDGSVSDEIRDDVRPGTVLNVVSSDGKYSFDVTLREHVRPDWKAEASDRIFVTSDPHGNMDCLVSLLQGNGVIDNDLNWSFGKDQAVVIGDIFDRGVDATQIFWLAYKLEDEAARAGGRFTFLIGNHETMVLAGDVRYTKEKYLELAKSLGIEFRSMMGPQTELGRWLSTRNTIQVIGEDLFVHAGLSESFLKKDVTIPEVNELVSRGLFMTKDERKADSSLLNFMFRTEGPVWYRGLVRKDKKYNPASPETLDAICSRYGVRRIFVGHTIFRNVGSFYKGKVIAVNVDNPANRAAGRTRAVLVKDGTAYSVRDGKNPRKI